jgi:hypothetical protein
MDNLSGSQLVSALMVEDPTMSIEDILDRTRRILFERKLKNIGHPPNTLVFLRALIDSDMTRDEITEAMSAHPIHIDDAIEFINSLEEVPVRRCCFPWKTGPKGKIPDTTPRPT